MRKRRRCRVIIPEGTPLRFTIPVLIFLAELAAPTSRASPPPAQNPLLPPAVLHFCAAHCSTWYLTHDHKGYAGVADYPGIPDNGPGVVIESFTRDSVVLNRTDAPNQWFPKGLKAIITGQISPDGNSLVNGKIRWTFGQSGIYDVRLAWGAALDSIPGSDAPAVAQAQPGNTSPAPNPQAPAPDNSLPPAVLHVCAVHCFTWYLTNDHKGYAGIPNYPGIADNSPGVVIESFTPDSVALNRTDPPNQWFPKGLKAVITGRISAAGNSLANGQIRWIAGQSGTDDVRMTWGSALDSLAGQDAMLVQGRPSGPLEDWINYLNSNFYEYMKEHEPPPPRELNPQEWAYHLQSAVDLARQRCAASSFRRGVNDESYECHGYDAAREELAEAYDEMHEWLDQMNELNDQRVALEPQCKAGKTEACTERDRLIAQMCAVRFVPLFGFRCH